MDKGIIIELDKLEYVGKATTMKIIIYGSQYGTAKQYAEELARKTSIDLKSYEDVTDINRYDTVIYVGGLYRNAILCGYAFDCGLARCKHTIVARLGKGNVQVLYAIKDSGKDEKSLSLSSYQRISCSQHFLAIILGGICK